MPQKNSLIDKKAIRIHRKHRQSEHPKDTNTAY